MPVFKNESEYFCTHYRGLKYCIKSLGISHLIQSSFILIDIISQGFGLAKDFKQPKIFKIQTDRKILCFRILLFDKLFIYLMAFVILCVLCSDIRIFFQCIFYPLGR